MNIAKYIDHTILKAEATPEDVKKVCEEAIKNSFAAVCINPVYVPMAKVLLSSSDVKVATVIGFPLGANSTYTKVIESEKAIEEGADELDMVMAVGLFKGGKLAEVEADIKDIVNAASGRVIKVILETGLLTPDEIFKASKLSMGCGAAFVKTSTGFGPRGASVEDIKIMKEAVGEGCQIKASGGIKTTAFAKELIEAGATRIGTSAGVAIISGG